jgi:FkbM family methyltransferase
MNLLKLPTHNPQHYQWVRPDSEDDLLVLREIWCENVYEVHASDINQSKVVIDIGAHIGTFSIYASQFDPAIQVHAYEPEPSNYKVLEKNIEENGLTERIHLDRRGLWSEETTKRISSASGGSTVMDELPDGEGENASLITLDYILNDMETVDVLKIDIEGAENAVLLAASHKNLGKCRYITVELDERNQEWGKLVEHLSETHHVRTMGKMSVGGMLFARRYE